MVKNETVHPHLTYIPTTVTTEGQGKHGEERERTWRVREAAARSSEDRAGKMGEE